MKHLKLFKTNTSAVGKAETPLVFFVNEAPKPLYAGQEYGKEVKIVIDENPDSAEIKVEEPQFNKPLKFTAMGETSTISLIGTDEVSGTKHGGMYKSADGKDWESWDEDEITLEDGESIYIKGNNAEFNYDPNGGFNFYYIRVHHFVINGTVAMEGNIMSLLGDEITEINSEYCFYRLFNDCKGLKTVNIELPATQLTRYFYGSLFYNSGVNYVKVSAPVWDNQSTENWLLQVPSYGTVEKPSNLEMYVSDYGGIPTSWTVINY